MGIFDGMLMGQDYTNKSLQNQQLRDTLQTYPDLLRAQLQLAQAQGGIAGVQAQYAQPMAQADLTKANQINEWYPKITAADIRSKNTYADMAPYTESSMLASDPAAQMIFNRMKIIPQLVSNDGGMTMQPQPQGGIAGGIPGLPSGASGANNNVGNYPVLPTRLTAAQGAQIPQQLANGPNGQPPPAGLAAPIQTGVPGLDQMYQMRMNNMMAQMSRNPMFGNTKGGAGGTYSTPNGPVSTDTTANTTADQRTIAAVQRVAPLLGTLSNNLSQFQTLAGEAKLKLGQAGNYIFGQNNQTPNQYALGESALKTAPEGLLKAWGLNVTNDSLKSMEDAIKPIEGESPQGYQSRIIVTLKTLQDNQDQAAQRLAGGTNLNKPKESQSQYKDEDIEYTAKKYGLTNDQVKQKLGIS